MDRRHNTPIGTPAHPGDTTTKQSVLPERTILSAIDSLLAEHRKDVLAATEATKANTALLSALLASHNYLKLRLDDTDVRSSERHLTLITEIASIKSVAADHEVRIIRVERNNFPTLALWFIAAILLAGLILTRFPA